MFYTSILYNIYVTNVIHILEYATFVIHKKERNYG